MWGGSPSRNLVNFWETDIPTSWNPATGENIKWVAELGSQGYANPVIAEGRIFVGTNNERERNPSITGDKGVVMCFRDEDGELLWQAVHDKLASGRVNDWPQQGVASTVAVDRGRVYWVSNRCELVCADIEGFLDGENDGPYLREAVEDEDEADVVWVLDMIGELGVRQHNMANCSVTEVQ